MKKLAIALLTIFIGLSFSQCNSVDKQLKETAALMNKSCPMMVDSETRLDSVSVPASKEIHYHYTLVNMSKEQMQVTQEQLSSTMKALFLNYIKSNNAEMKAIKKAKVTFVYECNYSNGERIADIKITPDDYK